ncbi:MAG: mycothiol conjugate amidase Mca, partial [Actinobacteria bacterium HGW-Actinobacteria-5]
HIQCHRVSMAAVDAAADPSAWPEHGEPWVVPKVYYDMTLHRGRFAALDAAMHEAGMERPYAEWLTQWSEDTDRLSRLTTFVPCADFFEVRNRALLAHATQIDPDGRWFAVPLEIQKAGWPTEDYQLVRSTVAVTLPESDLFAGVRDAEPGNAWSYSI